MKLLTIILTIILAFLFSCEKPIIPDATNIIGKQGAYILNQGNFSWSNASLSFLNFDSLKMYNHIFESANNSPLGDVAQSMVIRDSLAYITLNNSGKIYVMNTNTNMFIGKMTGITSPRYIQFVNDDKAYVSDLYQTSISIINPSSLTVTGSIPVGCTSEKMMLIDNKLIVISWSFENKLLIIDVNNDLLIDSLEVGLQPNSMVLDKNKKLWILCDGGFTGIQGGQEFAKLQRINLASMTIEKEFVFSQLSESPIELQINSAKDNLFYINGGIFSMSIDDNNLPETAIIQKETHNFYGLKIHNATASIYACDTKSYIQPGVLYRYTNTGSLVDSFEVGIVPGFICFKE